VKGMDIAIAEAGLGLEEGGIPIGSALLIGDQVLGQGHNRRIQRGSAILHGEMDALENAGRQAGSTYREATIYTTLSPCDMCTGAILLYGIPRVIVGENETYMGAEGRLRERGVEVQVLNDSRCIEMMRGFIADNPELWNEDIGET